MDKTRKINVVMFEADEGVWKIAVNLPDLGLTKVMSPMEALLISNVLAGDTAAGRAASVMAVGGTRIKEFVSSMRRNVDDDLLPEVAMQLDRLAMLAKISNNQLFSAWAVEQPANQYVN